MTSGGCGATRRSTLPHYHYVIYNIVEVGAVGIKRREPCRQPEAKNGTCSSSNVLKGSWAYWIQ